MWKSKPNHSFLAFIFSRRLNRLQKVTPGDAEQLVHIVQLDLRDTGLQELDVTALRRLELLRCDRNTLSRLRVNGLALKSLHAAHNGTSICNGLCKCLTDGVCGYVYIQMIKNVACCACRAEAAGSGAGARESVCSGFVLV